MRATVVHQLFAAGHLMGFWSPLLALDPAIVGTWEFADGSSQSWKLTVDENENVHVDGQRAKVTTDSICQVLPGAGAAGKSTLAGALGWWSGKSRPPLPRGRPLTACIPLRVPRQLPFFYAKCLFRSPSPHAV